MQQDILEPLSRKKRGAFAPLNFMLACLLFFWAGFCADIKAQCPASPSVSVSSQTAATCPSNGSVTLGSNGVGNPDVTYEITAAPNSSYIGLTQASTATTFSNLEPGAYTITMRCVGSSATTSVSFTIANSYTPLSGTVAVSSSCSGGTPNNTITLSNIIGSATPLQYAFHQTSDPNIPDNQLTYGTATTYNTSLFGDFIVRIKDNCGAIVTYPVNIAPPPAYNISYPGGAGVTKTSCTTATSNFVLQLVSNNNSTAIVPPGGVTVNVYLDAGGCTKGALYSSTFFPAGTDLSNPSSVYTLPYGQNVAIEVVNACGVAGSIRCQNAQGLSFTSDWKAENASCDATTASSINLKHLGNQVSFGTVTYTLYRNGVAIFSSTNPNDPGFSGLSTAGGSNIYRIIASDACGSTDTTDFVTPAGGVSVGPASSAEVSCLDLNRVNAGFPVTGNIPRPPDVLPRIISGPCCIGQTAGQTLSVGYFYLNNVVPGTYQVAFDYAGGVCAPLDTFTVVVPPVGINFSITGTVNQICQGGASISSNPQFTASTHTDSIVLKTSSGTFVASNSTGVFNNVAPGTYVLEYYPYSTQCNTNYGGIVTRDTVTVLAPNDAPQVAKKFGFICEDAGGTQLSTGTAVFEIAGFGPYDVYYSTTTTQPLTPQLTAQTSPVTITGLTANQTYNFWFKDQCSNTSPIEQLGILTLPPQRQTQTVHPCVGSPYTLSMLDYPTATYEWKKGTSVVSNTKDYFIANYNSSFDGTYTGTMTINGCVTRSFDVTISSTQCGQVLPVILRSFTAKKSNNVVELKWTTSSEINSSKFYIERSTGTGTGWQTIGVVDAAGHSSTDIHYSFTDAQPVSGNNFYRILMVDLDGQSKYSPQRVVAFNTTGNSVAVFPNPVTDKLTIAVADWNKIKSIRLMDISGRQVYRSAAALDGIDMSKQAAGTYVLQIQHQDGTVEHFKIQKR